MRDLKRMRDRFMRDSSAVRMGNLASDLLRLSKWLRAGREDEAIIDLIRQIAWCMEWTGDLASAELAQMQREICRWRRSWLAELDRHILALRASQMSSRALEWSGFLQHATSRVRETP